MACYNSGFTSETMDHFRHFIWIVVWVAHCKWVWFFTRLHFSSL